MEDSRTVIASAITHSLTVPCQPREESAEVASTRSEIVPKDVEIFCQKSDCQKSDIVILLSADPKKLARLTNRR
jgi:hypothetical protein